MAKSANQDEIRTFAVKAAIVGAVAFIALGLSAVAIDALVAARIEDIKSAINDATGTGGRKFWAKVEQALEEQADPKTDISAEKKEKLLRQIKIISDRWRPFAQQAIINISGPTKGN